MIVEFNIFFNSRIVGSKVCAIQVLLHPRVVDSKVKVVEPMVVESKAVEYILHSIQGKSLKKGVFFSGYFPYQRLA